MLIDVSDASTIPIEVKNKIYQSFSALSNDVVNRIKCQKANHNNDILCAIEDYYGPFRATRFYDELNTVLEKYDLICYHATKVCSKSILLKTGLKTNDWDVYCSNLKSAYMNMKFPDEEIQKAVDIVKGEYNRKYAGHDRKAQVCFFTNMSMFEGEYINRCEQEGLILISNSQRGIYTHTKHLDRLVINALKKLDMLY